jgi:uncharacterized damage-inducible protein DinB
LRIGSRDDSELDPEELTAVAREREVLALEPMADDPEVGRWLSALEDARRDTLREVDGLSHEALDRRPEGEANSIGTLLYHVALIEADWLLTDILGPESAPPWPHELLPWGDRDPKGELTDIEGISLDLHLERLDAVRSLVHQYVRPMPASDFHRLRARTEWDVSPAWVIHHLLQHEAEHRSQIAWLKGANAAR